VKSAVFISRLPPLLPSSPSSSSIVPISIHCVRVE
jgi:hypothetical protein